MLVQKRVQVLTVAFQTGACGAALGKYVQASLGCRLLLPLAGLFALAGCHSSPPTGTATAQNAGIVYPGADPWRKVSRDRVAADCGLDPALLDAAELEMSKSPYAIVRYGKLCWSGGTEQGATEPYEVMSVTKTLAATLFGIIASRTGVNEDSYVRDWLNPVEMAPVNPDAKVMHLLSLTAASPVLAYGLKTPWVYDSTGVRELNRIALLMDKVVKAHPDAFPGSTSIAEMAINELFVPLGMSASSWPGDIAAFGMRSSVHDMARLGLLLLRKGRWGDRQLIDEDYVYRMTHPSFEDANTGYGYLTWLNAQTGVPFPFDDQVERNCSPFASWQRYPHPAAFESPDSRGGSPFLPALDIGLFWADGAGGQMIYVHRGLDLVIVVRDDADAQGGEITEFHRLWRLMRPALVALDPVYKGDEARFCEAYRRSAHAPDLLSSWSRDSGFGSVGPDPP